MANEIQEGLPSSGAGTSIATLEKGTDVATPEERIGEWWQEHFGGSKQESPPLSEEIQTAEIPAATEAAPPGQEPPAGGGEGSNGGPEEPGGPEGPRGPDYLWSSEFRAKRFSVVKKIIALESLPYAEQYNSGNQFKLEKLYEKWKELEALDNKKSYLRKPFNPTEFEEAAEVTQPKRYESQDLTDLPLVEELFDILNHPVPIDPQGKEAWENEVANARNNVSKYFKEAHNQGLLDSIDDSLRSVALEIQQGLDQGLSPDAIMTGIEESWSRGIEGKVGVGRRIAAIEDMAKRTFQAARRANPEIGKLEGVWDVYIQLALDRLTLLFDPNRPRPLPIEGGFTFEAEEGGEFKKLMDEGEIYWRPTYANYFTVYARNEEQFERARETFIRWMRSGLGKSPEELIQKVNGFKEALTSAGQRAGLQEYTVEKRQELEALMGVIVANFFNEQYNVDYFKQGWTWVSQHEGPARMLELIKTSRGVTAAIIYKFDKDPRFELLFSPHGRRGQLMGRKRNAIEMGALQKEILAILNAEVMGIAIKTYHPDDPEKRLDKSNNIYKSNLREIAKFKSDEEFKSLYEGFDLEEQNRLYNRLERKQKAIIIQQAIKDGMDTRHLSDEERAIYAEFAKENGQDIYLDPADKLTLTRLGRARKIQQALEAGTDPKKLEGEDKIMYEEAKNAVDLAYEIYGAMGEKAKRGGGVFLVDRKDKEGRAFRDYLPSHLAEKFIHFAENWTQATYGEELTQELQDKLERKYLSSNEYKMLEDTLKRSGLSDQKRQEIERRLKSKYLLADELKYKVDQARRLAIWALKTHGYEAKLWDFTLLRNGKVIDPNTLGYTEYGVRPDKLDPIEKYRYAVPENPRILGYNSKGEGVILVFDDEGKLVTDPTTGLEFDPDTGKPLIFNKKPDEQNRQLIVFDNLNIHTRAERMLLKTPTGTIDPETKKMTVEGTENVHVDFDIATHHIYSRWTGHPYWGYQEEDAGLILTEEAFEGARAIKEGKLRWENAPPHAVQLLILDPTLNRVGHFDLEGLECVVNLAAGERSYLGHYRIGDELYMNFFPEDADRTKNRTAYVLQDHGGCTKQWFHMRAEAAYWPDYKVRRLRTFIPFMTLHFGSMSDMWGAPGGALDVFRMMGYKKYPMVGQFAMDKWVKQLGGAQDVYEAYSDWYSEQEKKLKEGLGKKLNNEADMLKKLYNDVVVNRDLTPPSTKEDKYEQFLITVRETLNRLEVVENRNTVLESLMRGERAPLNLEGIEIFRRTQYGAYILDNDGNRLYNPDIEKIEDSGSSRHSNKFLHYRYARFIRSLGYYRLYPDVAMYYKLMDNRLNDYPRLAEEASASNEMVTVKIVTGWDWLESKMNN